MKWNSQVFRNEIKILQPEYNSGMWLIHLAVSYLSIMTLSKVVALCLLYECLL